MHVLHHNQNLPDKKASMFDSEGYNFGDDVEKIFPFDKVHDEVYEIGVFDQFVEIYDERMFGSGS